MVYENLHNAFPEKDAEDIRIIAKKYYRHLSSLMVEIIKMATISPEELKARFKFKNLHLMNNYHEQGRSTLICSAHYGNWEWGTLALGLNTTAVVYPIYKPVSNEAFGEWFKQIRSRFGNQLIPMRQTLRALNASKDVPTIFCFGNDQTPLKEESTYWLNFLHQPTAILLGLEKIAVRTNRPVFYMRVRILKRGYYEVECVPLCMEPAASKPFEITNLHVNYLEQIIIDEPAYWLWSHRRWKHKPED
ncbi:lipid A biosynthesis protein [Pedobacter quisquiliarum]|uniref:Lipid A biosynthesis protein n=1 Tax=Pedobacter quisquiliarum TaxID=1834438 RepID=A0A916U4K2_9SPHI|nr:lipid A biosynthesis protein [Pedobacter quisquiliarum]